MKHAKDGLKEGISALLTQSRNLREKKIYIYALVRKHFFSMSEKYISWIEKENTS